MSRSVPSISNLGTSFVRHNTPNQLFLRSGESWTKHLIFWWHFQTHFLVNVNVGLSTPHDDVVKWKPCPRYWPFVRGIHRSTVNSPHKGQWRGTLMFSFIRVWINSSVNNREAGEMRSFRAHYDVIVMYLHTHKSSNRWKRADCSIYIALVHDNSSRVGGGRDKMLAMTILSTTNQLILPYLFHWQLFLWPKGVL